MHQAGAEMSLKRVAVGPLARAHRLDEILLVGIIGEVALVLGDQLVIRAEYLPAAAVALPLSKVKTKSP